MQVQVVQPVPLVHRYTGGFLVQFGSVRQVYPFVLSNPFVMDVFGYRYFSPDLGRWLDGAHSAGFVHRVTQALRH